MPVATPGDTATVRRTVTDETIQTFATLTGDDNPLHTDPDYAADGIFGGRVAHGMLTGGFVSAALAALPGDVVYLRQEFDFEAPVRPGAVVVCEATVREHLGGDRVRVETVAVAHDADSAAETDADTGDDRTDDADVAEPDGNDTDSDDRRGDDGTDGECVLRGEAVVLSVPHDD